jgi:hypothetical protein
MTTQPEALRLADWLDGDGGGLTTLGDCAAELRRLSAVEAQRDALLEALKDMLNAENTYPYGGMSESEIAAIDKARAAIAAVEGEKT